MPLSFSTITTGESRPPAFRSASNATPPVSAPSPTTATTLPSRSSPWRIASLIPTAYDAAVEAWPAPMMSCSDSGIERNGARPRYFLIVPSSSRRPVRILCGYAWWPTSQSTLSRGESSRLWIPTATPHHPRGPPERLRRPGVLSEVAADLADRVDDHLAHLLGHLLELVVAQAVQFLGAVDVVEEG